MSIEFEILFSKSDVFGPIHVRKLQDPAARGKFGNDIIYCKVDKLEYGHGDNKSYLKIT